MLQIHRRGVSAGDGGRKWYAARWCGIRREDRLGRGEAQPRATIRVVEAWPWASCVDLGWRGERMEQEDHGGRKGTVDSGWRTGVDEAALRRPGGREGGGGEGVNAENNWHAQVRIPRRGTDAE